MDDLQAASVEEPDGAPAADEAASQATEATGAPATPPEGYIEQKRYEDLRSNHDRISSLIDRARQGDPEAASELGFEFIAEEEQYPDQGDEEEQLVADPRIEAHDEWIQQQQQERVVAAFNAHLDRLAGSPDMLDEHDRQVLLNESIANGFNETATEAAFGRWKEREKAREQKALDKYLKTKRAPHVAAGGTGATETPYRDDMSLRELTRAAQEQAKLASEM